AKCPKLIESRRPVMRQTTATVLASRCRSLIERHAMYINAFRANHLRLTASLTAALSSCSALALRAQTATHSKASALERTVDTTIKPGDDFFAYANGAWLKATAIPQ